MTLCIRRLALLLCLFAPLANAKQATFSSGVLTLDTVNFNGATYEAQLAPVPNSNPLAFTVTTAKQVTATTDPIATFAGTTLSVANVLINGTLRARANLQLVGQNPLRFQLSSYTELRSVKLDTGGATLAPGKVFFVSYTGGVLEAAKVKLNIGSTALALNVADNVIAATVPAGISGSQTLTITLDGETFQLTLPVTAGAAAIANPKTYVSSVVDEVVLDLQRLALPAGLLDRTALTNQLAAMSEADAQQAALLIRENLAGLAELMSGLQTSSQALTAVTPTAGLPECDRLTVLYLRASSVMAFSTGVVVVGGVAATALPLSPAFALAASVATASAIVAGEMAARYQAELLTLNCLRVEAATLGSAEALRSEVTVLQTLTVFESRPQTINITEQQQLASSEVRSGFLSASGSAKATLDRLSALLTRLGFSATSAPVTAVKNLQARLKTDDRTQATGNAHKFTIRSISDSRVTGSVLSTKLGTLTLLLDRKDTDMPEGQSISFTMELYNATDDVSLTVPVKLNGASLLEDLKQASLGLWAVTDINSTGEQTFTLALRANGVGAYVLPLTAQDIVSGTFCKKAGYAPQLSGKVVGQDCEYPITWSIRKSGDQYLLTDEGFWFRDGSFGSTLTRDAIALPVSGFNVYISGSVNRRYRKQ